MKYVLPVLIAVAALLVSGTAAYYSVTGLGKLFAGASIPVMIMAASLEFSKLISASLLYRYWAKLGILLKTYLTVAVVVLILITSLGIYGFLTAAYQQTSSNVESVDTEISLYETQKSVVQSQVDNLTTEQVQLSKSISDLRSGLSSNVIKYTDAKGNILTSTSSATRAALEKQLASSTDRQVELDKQLSTLNIKLVELQTKISELQIGLINSGELGPLKYISSLTNTPIESIVNYLVLTIVFVFDPLAISLVIAANFAFKNANNAAKTEAKVDKIKKTKKLKKIAKSNFNDLPTVEEVEKPIDIQPEEEIQQPIQPEPAVNTIVETPAEPPTVVRPLRRGLSRNAPPEDTGKRYL